MITVIVLSVLLFLAVNLFARSQRITTSSGLEVIALIMLYTNFWIIPSLLAWAVWATWFK